MKPPIGACRIAIISRLVLKPGIEANGEGTSNLGLHPRVCLRMAGSRTFLRILCKTWDPPNNHIQDKDLALTNAGIATSAEKMTPSSHRDRSIFDLSPHRAYFE